MPAARPSFFLRADLDRARLPVVLLSGFLGAGKTTLVNTLLRHPSMARTAVAVNEFGAIPLDADLIDHGADKTVVMANGCLCCNLAGDMEEAVMRVFTRREAGDIPTFDRLIIEPSGLADPAPIAQGILRNPVISRALRLEAIVTVVDALFGEDHITRFAETRKQIALADTILVSKADLVDTATVEQLILRIGRLNPAASVRIIDPRDRHGSLDSQVSPLDLFPASFLDADAPPAAMTAARAGFHADGGTDLDGHASDYVALSLTAERPLDWHRFETWLRSVRLPHAERLLRLKAMLDIAGSKGPVVLHGIHHVLHPAVELDCWPDEMRRSRLVLIVEQELAGAIRASWANALPGLIAASASARAG